MSDNQKVFIAYLTSGLGNRLRPLASAIAYCNKTGRKLKVYWDQITPNGCLTPLEKLFENQFEAISLEELGSLSNCTIGLYTEKGPGHGVQREAERFGRTQLQTLSITSAPYPCSLLGIYDESDVIIVYDNNFLECLPREESIAALRSLIPSVKVVDRIKEIVAELEIGPWMKGVHARGTDFGIQSAQQVYDGLIRNAIDIDGNEQFFLSTDDLELEKGISAAYPGLVLSRDDRLHLTLNEGKESWTDPDSFTISSEHGLDALVDIYLLSCTELVVYHPGSTFGEIAQQLHGVLYEHETLSLPDNYQSKKAVPNVQDSDFKHLFYERAAGLVARKEGVVSDILSEGSPGPQYLERLPGTFAYWETLGYNIPIMERMFVNSNSRPYLEWDGELFSTLASIGIDRFPLDAFKSFCPYPEAISQMQTLRSYMGGRNIMIVGSETFWVELFCVLCGAASVTTVEYREIRWTTPPRTNTTLNTITWEQFSNGLDKYEDTFNLAIAYSSIEHSGLGRYGDPIMPLGDLYTFFLMSRCLLNTGMCAIAVPTGQDLTHFNAHRIYGEKRIRAMEYIADFRYLGIITPDKEYLANDPDDSLKEGWSLSNLMRLPLGTYRQPILCFGAQDFDIKRY